MRKFWGNQKGQGTVAAAAVLSGAVLSAATVVFYQGSQSKQQRRISSIKSEMIHTVSKLQGLFLQSRALNCVTSAGTVNCQVNQAAIATLQKRIPGCQGNGSDCGIQIVGGVWDQPNRKYTASVQYNGTEFPIAPMNVEVNVPIDLIIKETISCPESAPFFVGLDVSSNPICKPLPEDCPANSYVSAVDYRTMTVTCSPLAGDLSCPSGQYLTSVNWTASGFQSVCRSKENPFTQFSFQPRIFVGRYPTAENVVTVTTTTTTTTTLPGSWTVGEWGACSASCGLGSQSRSVSCNFESCWGAQPPSSQACDNQCPTSGAWTVGEWGACSTSCGGGTQSRSVSCNYDSCMGAQPANSQACNTQSCGRCPAGYIDHVPAGACGNVVSYVLSECVPFSQICPPRFIPTRNN